MPEAFVFTTGDNAYFDGNAADYDNCYKPRWGRHLSTTYPEPGQPRRLRQRTERQSPTSITSAAPPVGRSLAAATTATRSATGTSSR